MKRSAVFFLLSMMLLAGRVAAEEIHATLFKANADPDFIVIRYGKEPNDMVMRLNIGAQVRIVDRNGKPIKERLHSKLFTDNVGLVVTREKKGGEVVTTAVKVMAVQK